jgi:class 3 adenylate cyclase
LFADLKGSTAFIEGLDPEEARAIIDPALQLMTDAVHQYDGYVAQAVDTRVGAKTKSGGGVEHASRFTLSVFSFPSLQIIAIIQRR